MKALSVLRNEMSDWMAEMKVRFVGWWLVFGNLTAVNCQRSLWHLATSNKVAEQIYMKVANWFRPRLLLSASRLHIQAHARIFPISPTHTIFPFSFCP